MLDVDDRRTTRSYERYVPVRTMDRLVRRLMLRIVNCSAVLPADLPGVLKVGNYGYSSSASTGAGGSLKQPDGSSWRRATRLRLKGVEGHVHPPWALPKRLWGGEGQKQWQKTPPRECREGGKPEEE